MKLRLSSSAVTVACGSTSKQQLSVHLQFGSIYPAKMKCFVPKTTPNLPRLIEKYPRFRENVALIPDGVTEHKAGRDSRAAAVRLFDAKPDAG